ncbi:hypothetical protein E2C01_095324 [Portunus trituberculatus]|uniref:Uncharacterized protein n=1 Tax=Portunus trituberculatus TaxID=210409 RepID=A0A5B7JYF8_PORTR|nr:hypothetical protein [Portunus trituberculatus]
MRKTQTHEKYVETLANTVFHSVFFSNCCLGWLG